MSTLGVGVRVWIGWCPGSQVVGAAARRARLRRGVIVGGPYPAGTMRTEYDEIEFPSKFTTWAVRADGALFIVDEALLFPIDDGEESEPREVEEPVEMTT